MLALLGVVLVAFSLRSAVAALSPIIAEIERDMAVPTWVGGWTVPLLALGAVLLIAIPAGIIVARPTTIEDDWEQRHGRWS